MLESFDKDIISAHPDSSPYIFGKLKNESIYFPNIYATGRRSLMGLSAIMLSIPHIQGLLPLNSGLENRELFRVGKYYNDNGYFCLYVGNHERTAERIESLSSYFGVNKLYTKEDIPLRHKYPEFPKGYDYEGLEFFAEKINEINGNFVSYYWSSSTHVPYDRVFDENLKIYSGKNMVEQYLNRVRYVDNAVENFMNKVSKYSWFDNTVFIFVPDHRAIFTDKNPTRKNIGDEYFNSFMMIYAPKLLKPYVDNVYGTLSEITPTIIDLGKMKKEYNAFSTSLFDKKRKNQAIVYGEDNKIYIFSPDYRNIVDLNNINIDKMDETQKEALALGEHLYKTVKDNKYIMKK